MPADETFILIGSPAAWARRLAYATAAGLFLGVTGAFGTFESAPIQARIVGWVIMFWAGTLILPPLAAIMVGQGRRLNLPVWLTLPTAVAIGSVPMTFISRWATHVFINQRGSQPLVNTYFEVVAVALPVVAAYVGVKMLLSRRDEEQALTPQATPSAVAATPPRFLARLPARLGSDLLCLQMEDHYVRAHTALGSDLILMRIRDAVAELEGLDGLQVHRSWWVAARAVTGHETGDRRLTLKLVNGLEIPVARSSIPTVRAAGWLKS